MFVQCTGHEDAVSGDIIEFLPVADECGDFERVSGVFGGEVCEDVEDVGFGELGHGSFSLSREEGCG